MSDTFHLLIGNRKLSNKIGDKVFYFDPRNHYPNHFEAYANLNQTLANMFIESCIKETRKQQIVVEYDTANGIFGSLIKEACHKFYSILSYEHKRSNVEFNLNEHQLKQDEYYKIMVKLNKSNYLIKQILSENADDTHHITVVYQDFGNLPSHIRKMSNQIFTKSLNFFN
jgi:hypothetical protein